MDFKKLKEFIAIAKEAGASELTYADGDTSLGVSFPLPSQAPIVMPHYAQAPMPVASVTNTPTPVKNPNLLEVVSPFVGTFYRQANPEAPAYVKVGDRVKKGQVLCIVEAMKIMNEIESELTGEIVEICIENETYVEYGQVLFRLKP